MKPYAQTQKRSLTFVGFFRTKDGDPQREAAPARDCSQLKISLNASLAPTKHKSKFTHHAREKSSIFHTVVVKNETPNR